MMASEKIKVIAYTILLFVSMFFISIGTKEPDTNSGFAEDPRDSNRQIYIDDTGNQYRYLEEYGTENETGEILQGIQVIGINK